MPEGYWECPDCGTSEVLYDDADDMFYCASCSEDIFDPDSIEFTDEKR